MFMVMSIIFVVMWLLWKINFFGMVCVFCFMGLRFLLLVDVSNGSGEF